MEHFTGKSCHPKQRWNWLKTLKMVSVRCVSCLSFAFPWWVCCCQLCSSVPTGLLLPGPASAGPSSSARAVSLHVCWHPGFWLCRALVCSAGLGQGSPGGAAMGESSSRGLSPPSVTEGKSDQFWQIFKSLETESTSSGKTFQSFGRPPPAP